MDRPPSSVPFAGAPALRGPLVAATAVLLALLPAPAGAQNASCEFLDGTRSFNMITLAGGGTISYLGSPRIGCPDGVRIVADSAISYSSQDMTHLLGDVVFRDGTRILEAQEARYFPSTGRLNATGQVRLEDRDDGSIIENGDLVLLRATEFRPRDELTVTTGPDGVRPRATLFVRPAADTAVAAPADSLVADSAMASPADSVVADSAMVPPADSLVADSAMAPPADSLVADSAMVPPTDALPADSALALPADSTVRPAAPPADTTPYLVVADRLHLVGDSYFEATGNAVIDRDSLHATAQRAEYDQAMGHLLLERNARVDGSTYDLTGEEIVLDLPTGEIRKVTARRQAVLTGEEIRLDAPVIHLFLAEGVLDRLVAVPMDAEAIAGVDAGDADALSARPVATAEDFVLTADSVDVRAPAQRLDRIFAVGAARGESTARDSLNVPALPDVARRDWIDGDTIVAVFGRADTAAASAAGGQGTGEDEYVLEELIAAGSARSLYRLLPTDSTSRAGVDPPAVHYVTGTRITIGLREGQVERMEVEGATRGYHLEPVQRRAAGDSLAVPADTVPVPPTGDTLPGVSARPAGPSEDRGGPGSVADLDASGEPRRESFRSRRTP